MWSVKKTHGFFFLQAFLFVLFASTKVEAQQNLSTPKHELPVTSSFSMRRHYFLFGLDASTIVGLKGGFSLGYFHSLTPKRNEYVGIQFTGLPSHQKKPMNFNYYGNPVRNAQAETTLSIISLQLSGYYFFHPDQKNSPFISFQSGSTFVQNQIETSFDYFSSLPFFGGWVHNGDFAEQKSQTLFTSGVNGGYWFSLDQNKGICIKLGINYTQPFKWIDVSTAMYNSDILQYQTKSSSPISICLEVCMLF